MKSHSYIAKLLVTVIGLASMLTACEKEIDIDYREVGSLYVAEGIVSQTGTRVRLSTTQDVTDNSKEDYVVAGATIVLTCKRQELVDTLRYVRSGIYTSSIQGEPGLTYDLDIQIGDQHFRSSSTMQQKPVMNSFRFVWKEMLGERILFADLKLQDTPDENSYYFMHIYRNGTGYRWAVMNDEKNKGGELQQLFQCTTQRDMNDKKDDALQDGDNIRLEIRSIDRLSYDYLYSMQVMDNAGTNPVANFTGGCLGYFSACYIINYSSTFRLNQVEQE